MLRKIAGWASLLTTVSLLTACSGAAGQSGSWILALLGVVVVGAAVLVVLFWLSRRS